MMKNLPRLSLVGAGPGDPDLISLKAVKILKSADVILYDALANQELLRHCSEHAIKRFVGKRFGCHEHSQDEINSLIAEYAFTHGHVVRLKGGDPLIFGRAQEEIEFAKTMGIAVDVVPGISSVTSVPCSQMIPLTCRGISESFWVTTGTTRSGDISKDLELAARSSATIVILMAMSKLEEIMDIFIKCGKQDLPVAIIQNGTLPEEKILIGKVKDIYFRALHAGLLNPSVIIVGEVVRLHPSCIKELNEKTSIVNYQQPTNE